MSIENVKSNFVVVNLSPGGDKVTLDLGLVLFAEVLANTSLVYIAHTAGAPNVEHLTIEGDFRNIVAGAGGAGMNSGPLFGDFTNVDAGVFVSTVVVNFSTLDRIDANNAFWFLQFGLVGAFEAYTILESINDVLGGMGHSIQDVGIFRMTQTGNTIPVPVQAAATTLATGGTVPDDTYFLKVTALNTAGETTGSNEVTITTAGGNLSTITANWAASVGANGGYNVYIGTASDGETSFFHVAAGVLTKVITALPGTAGTLPASNTATDSTLNTQEFVNVNSIIYQTAESGAWRSFILEGSEVLYVENVMDLVGG